MTRLEALERVAVAARACILGSTAAHVAALASALQTLETTTCAAIGQYGRCRLEKGHEGRHEALAVDEGIKETWK